MQPIDMTWGRLCRIYWLFLWRHTVGGVLLVILAGAEILIFRHSLVPNRHAVLILDAVICPLVNVVWAFFVIRMALRKQYRGFRLIMIEA
jgi:hypothetical protein